ncbi:MAG: Ig-like domain repeat protein [Lysobacterales bacterium]
MAALRWFPPRLNPAVLLLASAWALCALPARAQLFALSHDFAGASTELVAVDPQSGAVSPLPSGLGATELALAAVANDPFTQQAFALGPDPIAADGSLQLLRFDLASGSSQIVGNTGSSERVLALHFERTSQRLIAALADPASGVLRLVSIDSSSAALSPVHPGLADCCVLSGGASALSGGRLYLVGRLRSDAAGVLRLIGLSTSGDGSSTAPSIAALPGALVADPDTGQLHALMQSIGLPLATPSLQLVAVDGASGVLTPIGAALPGCCALAADVAAIQTGVLRAVGRVQGDSALSLLSFDLGSGAFSASTSALPNGRVFDALFDQLKGLLPSTTTITAIAPNPVAIGSSYLVSAQVTVASGSASGTVSIDDGLGNLCSFAAPSGSCSLPAVALGSHTVSATFASTGSFIGSSDSATVQVIQASSITSITSILPSPSTVGAAYAVNVGVAGFNPSGSINVDDGLGGNCVIVLPASSCNLVSTGTGPRTISASYGGDLNNLPSATSAAHQVVAAISSIAIDSILPSPSVVGQNYVVSATVSGFGAPSGTVTVDDGSGANCQIVLPANSCGLTSTVAGAKTVTANYGGDSNNSASSTNAAHQVERAASTTLIAGILPSPAVAGQPSTVTVSVTGFGTPTGAVNVDDGNGASCVVNLPASSCALAPNVAGALTVTANYTGDVNNLPSSANSLLTVTPAQTVLNLSASANPIALGAAVQFNASIGNGVSPLTGTVDFLADGLPIAGCSAVPVVSAAAACNTSFSTVGVIGISANYSGDANNLPASANLLLSVQALPVPTLSLPAMLALVLLIGLLAFAQRRA